MPDRSAHSNGSKGEEPNILPTSENSPSKTQDGNEGSAPALILTDHHEGTVSRHEDGDTRPSGQVVELPSGHQQAAGVHEYRKNRRVYNSVYQKETGHIFADPFGMGELENRDGVIVNLRREQEKERDREERKERDGEGDGGDGKGLGEG